MTTPYSPPESTLSDPQSNLPPSKRSAAFAVAGAVLSAMVFVGVGFLVVELPRIVELVQTNDPKLLAGALGQGLLRSAPFLILSYLGLIVSTITLLVSRYRKRWFLYTVIVSAIPSLVFFPLGTSLAAVTIVFFLAKRREFRKPVLAEPQL